MQQNTGGDYTSSPKTESSNRTLPMTNDVFNLLKKHKHKQDELKSIMGNYYVQNDYVCTRNNGEVISPNYLTRTFHSIISKSNLPQIRLHDLRHSVASNLLNNGMTVLQVQNWLGHSCASTTLNFYAHIDKTASKCVANALEKMIKINA
ncbi:MAG: site-specific integrase [Acutalibacteraceae bacterium]|nr:site-specific integrase [Acutalibacteraceae bacterium]